MSVTAHLDSGNITTTACPSCGQFLRRDLSGVQGIGQGSTIECQCACGTSFVVTLERRRHHRKPTEIRGAYIHKSDEHRGLISLKNLSRSGAGFEVNHPRRISKGDRVILRFNLDEMPESYVEKEAVTRKAERNYVGVEFSNVISNHETLAYYIEKE